MTLLAAGHETTASALTWALYWIHKIPKVRQRLLAELRTQRGRHRKEYTRLQGYD